MTTFGKSSKGKSSKGISITSIFTSVSIGAVSINFVNFINLVNLDVADDAANAQAAIGQSKASSLSPAHQMLKEMQQGNAPEVGSGSMQILKFSENQLSFAPLEGIERVLQWRINEKAFNPRQNFSSIVDKFKQQQRQQFSADGDILQAIKRLNTL